MEYIACVLGGAAVATIFLFWFLFWPNNPVKTDKKLVYFSARRPN